MAGIFDEKRMLQMLGDCTPEGETLLAGIHGITLQVNKKRTSYFDVYIGVTEQSLLVVECDERKVLNAYYQIPDKRKTVAEDLGVCFPLPEIRNCVTKTSILGAATCSLTFFDGSFLKLQLPKRGGLGNGMPHHAEYREKILAVLGECHRRG